MHTLTVWSDIACPFAHVAVSRLHRVRRGLGLDDQVRFDHRAFPLELFNRRPNFKPSFDTEVPVLAAVEPDAGWQLWQGPMWHWPVTTLPALEAVQAAKEQSLEAAEQLDLALRVAFFAESRCISLRSVILEVAEGCDRLDVATLAKALDEGRSRRAVIDDFEYASGDRVKGSPHLFAADEREWHNPGMAIDKCGDFLAVAGDDPGVYEEILRSVVD